MCSWLQLAATLEISREALERDGQRHIGIPKKIPGPRHLHPVSLNRLDV